MDEYSAVISIILGLLPIFIALYLRIKIPEEHKALRTMIMLLTAILALVFGSFMVGAAASQTTPANQELYATVGQWSSLGGLFGLLMGILGVGTAFGGRGGSSSSSLWGPGGSANPYYGGRDVEEITREERRRKKEKKYVQQLEGVEAATLESDVHLVNYLEQIKNYINAFVRRVLERSMNYDEMRGRMFMVIGRLQQIRAAMTNREQRDQRIFQAVRNLQGYARRQDAEELKRASAEARVGEVKEASAARAEAQAENIALRNIYKLKYDISVREERMKTMVEEIDNAINHLSQGVKKGAVRGTFTSDFKGAIRSLDNTINTLKVIVSIDQNILRLEKDIEEAEKIENAEAETEKKVAPSDIK